MLTATSLRFATSLAVLATAVVLPCSGTAHADEKQVCTQAYIQGQRLKQEDKLIEAREQLLVCARDTCPASLKKDCTQWAAEVEQSLPTVVVEARAADGSDVIDVKVMVDGKTFLEHIDGKPRPINPGVHTFKFQIEDAPAVVNKVVIVAGEKNRRLSAKFPGKEGAAAPAPTATSTSGTENPPPEGDGGSTTRPVPTSVYVLGGIGLAALGGWGYFAMKFDGQVKDLEACKPNCSQSAVDDASSTRTISYIPLGIGVVSLGVATVLFLTRPEEKASHKESATGFNVRQVPGGGLATFGTTF